MISKMFKNEHSNQAFLTYILEYTKSLDNARRKYNESILNKASNMVKSILKIIERKIIAKKQTAMF